MSGITVTVILYDECQDLRRLTRFNVQATLYRACHSLRSVPDTTERQSVPCESAPKRKGPRDTVCRSDAPACPSNALSSSAFPQYEDGLMHCEEREPLLYRTESHVWHCKDITSAKLVEFVLKDKVKRKIITALVLSYMFI